MGGPPIARFTEKVYPTEDNDKPVIQFPTDEMRQEFFAQGENVWLAGFVNYVDRLNFILSTGERPE